MEPRRRSALIYGLLLGVWLLVLGWQIQEHARVEAAAKTDLRNRSTGIANTLSAVVRALRFRGTLLQDRLQPVLDDMVNSGTNGLPVVTEVLSVALINTDGKPIVSAGDTNLIPNEALSESELWTADSVTFVNPVWGASAGPENSSNAIVVLPSFREMSNSIPRDAFERRGSNEMNFSNPPSSVAGDNPPPGPPPGMEGPRNGGPRRPPWLRWMDENQFKALTARRELHGLVLAMSTDNVRAVCMDDFWLRGIIVLFAGIAAIGAGLAWRNVAKTSDLQIRLVRASELNSHLKEMNLAAAGLAHETRNPLNIIRGMAQMISKSEASSADLREKSKAIVDETDKVAAQLNEFINYSRPREVRRAKTALNAVVTEVVRALNYDIEEKKIRVESKVEPFLIEADEQLLRQALFNLLLNSIQAVGENGQIQFSAHKNGSEATFEIRDDGPGVLPEQRREIFKPYFTTHQKGTGLGLAVVQQIVLVHGWEIECLGNEPKGAVFRISHLKPAA